MSHETSIPSHEMELRKAFAHFPSGLAAIAANVEGSDHVILVASFSVGISLNPPLVSFAVQKTSTTWPILKKSSTLGVSILSSGQDKLCRQLASKDKNVRWAGIEVERCTSGSVLLCDASLTFECSIYSTFPAGDHEMVLLEVKAFNAITEQDPLVFHGSRFRTLEVNL